MEHDRTDRLLTYPNEIFYYCYRTIENFLSKTFWYCLCNLYQGCENERGTREYCCICQIANDYSIDRLTVVKNDIFKLTEMYMEPLEDTRKIRRVVPSLDFWEEEVEFKFRDRHGKEGRSDLGDSIEFLYSL